MTELPSGLLFRSPLGQGGKPLFRSQADLAAQICAEPDGEFADRPLQSIKSYLSQVLKPSSAPNSRPISPAFESAIVEAAKGRISSEYDASGFASALRDGFARLKKESVPEPTPRVYEELDTESERASHHVVFTSTPAESVAGSKYAESLVERLVERLQLCEPSGEPVVKYEFFVNSENTAQQLWISLYSYLTKQRRLTRKQARDAIGRVNRGRIDSLLMVYVVDPLYVVIPTVVFDPNGANPRGFNLYYHDSEFGQEVSVAKMSADTVVTWKRLFYDPNSLLTGDAKPIMWAGFSANL